MGKTIMGAVVSLDGFIADDNDAVGPLFDWYGNGDVAWSFEGSDVEFRSTRASADFMRTHYEHVAVVVMGRRLFDLTNGWDGKPAAGDRVVDVAAGQIGGQALRLGLIDQVVVNLVPVVFGSGRPYFATGPLSDPILFRKPRADRPRGPRDASRVRRREALRQSVGPAWPLAMTA